MIMRDICRKIAEGAMKGLAEFFRNSQAHIVLSDGTLERPFLKRHRRKHSNKDNGS